MPAPLEPIVEWLDGVTALALVLTIIAILYLVRMLWRGAKKAFPGIKAAITFLDALFAMPVFMQTTTKSLEALRHEVLPNEGGSLRDDVETAMLLAEKLDLRISQLEQYDKTDHERIQTLEGVISLRREIRAQKQQEYLVDTDETPIPPPFPTSDEE